MWQFPFPDNLYLSVNLYTFTSEGSTRHILECKKRKIFNLFNITYNVEQCDYHYSARVHHADFTVSQDFCTMNWTFISQQRVVPMYSLRLAGWWYSNDLKDGLEVSTDNLQEMNNSHAHIKPANGLMEWCSSENWELNINDCHTSSIFAYFENVCVRS